MLHRLFTIDNKIFNVSTRFASVAAVIVSGLKHPLLQNGTRVDGLDAWRDGRLAVVSQLCRVLKFCFGEGKKL